MYIFKATYVVRCEDNCEVLGVVEFNDGGVLLDCVAESTADVWDYFTHHALREGRKMGWQLKSLECIAS